MIFDTHAHYDDEAFQEDRDELLNSLSTHGIEAVVNVGASIQTTKNTLELMKKLKQEYQTSLILITHDLGVVAKICDKVAVVYAGEIVESGTLKEIYTDKRHPYTIGLFDSLPDIENDASTLKVIQGMVPDPANLPDGCKFHPRCPYATEACQTGKIKPVKLSDSHMVRCNRFSDTEV